MPAETVSIGIIGEVADVNDPGGVLSGAIKKGDVVTGVYVYDSATPDTNTSPTVGDYRHTTAPHGITLKIGKFTFRTDPNNVDFLVEIVNSHGSPPRDNYLLRSYNNIFDVPVPESSESHISWQLDDPTATALGSKALPTKPPRLKDWQSQFGLTISSGGPVQSFHIRAHVSSAEKSR